MARYIDADKVMEEINRIGGHNLCEWETIGVKALIDRQPTADVAEVKHGEWEKRTFIIFDSEKVGYRCSECHTTWDTDTNYCPNCGAKKDGKALKEREKEC